MRFLGRVHEVNAIAISKHFDVDKEQYMKMELNKQLCLNIFHKAQNDFFTNEIPEDFKGNLDHLSHYFSYEVAYYQLIYEITHLVYKGVLS